MGNAPIVNIKGLTKRYGDLLAVDHLDLCIEEGEIYGLLGPNGSGKSTTIGCILSLLSYDKGTIELFGKKMTPTSYDIKKNIGIIMQEVAVFDEMNVYENIDYFCGLYVTDKEKRKMLVEEAIDFVGLSDFKKFRPKKLSGGLLRRLNIACGIAHKPKLIILDEPTVAVDPQSRNKIIEGIEQLNREGATIIYTSHYMEEVEQLCTKIAIIDKGEKIAEGTKEELKSMTKHTETIFIEARDLTDSIIDEVKQLPHVSEASYEDTILSVAYEGGKHNMVRVLELMQKHSIHLGKIYSELPTLNDVFLEITGKELRDRDED